VTAWRWRPARRSPRRRDQRPRPQAHARRAVRPGRRRADDALARRQLPDTGGRVEGQPRRRPVAAVHAAGGDDETLLRGRIVVAPGIDAIERAFDASKYGASPTSSSSRRRSRRSSTRHSSMARSRDARRERHRPVHAVRAPRRVLGRRRAGRARRQGRRAARRAGAGPRRRASAPARS
jgi:hypothetical protein